MNNDRVDSGIDAIGRVPWGTHFCQFYQSKEDLLDTLVPYFQSGLENGEFCVWVTSEPLTVIEAVDAMMSTVPGFKRYLKDRRIEIIPYSEWYLQEGTFDAARVLNGWIEKLDSALSRGFNGMRLTGNTFWLEKDSWSDFKEYERAVNDAIRKYRMIALCTYALERCGAVEIMDVLQNHEFALIKRDNRWEVIESSELKRTKSVLERERDLTEIERERAERLAAVLKQERDVLEVLMENTNAHVAYLDHEFRFLRVNSTYAHGSGYSPEELIGRKHFDLFPHEENERIFAEVRDSGEAIEFKAKPFTFPNDAGRGVTYWDWALTPVKDDEGNTTGVVLSLVDVTQSKRAEEAFRKAYETERRIAQALQENLIRPVPVIERLKTGILYKSAYEAERIGGDFYDIFPLDSSRIGILVGDVAGKGIQAAGFTETIRSCVRTLAHVNPSPGFVLSQANKVLLPQVPQGQFATASFLVVDRSAEIIRYASAGHPPAVFCRGHCPEFIQSPSGIPLGVFPFEYQETVLSNAGKDMIVLYTDGLVEARKGSDLFGERRLLEALADLTGCEPQDLVDRLLDRVHDFTEGKLEDDVAVVAVAVD